MEQELMWVGEYFLGIGVTTIMFFFMCVLVLIIMYVICYLLWIVHIYMTIRRRYREEVWWREYEVDLEELDNE